MIDDRFIWQPGDLVFEKPAKPDRLLREVAKQLEQPDDDRPAALPLPLPSSRQL